MSTFATQIARRHFNASTVRALAKRGIRVIGLCTIPGDGEMAWANGTTGYQLDDNGTFRIRTHAEVRALAGVA